MTHKEKAMKIFYEKFNCSQAVLGAYAEEYGLTIDQAMKVAACFSGGVRKGEVIITIPNNSRIPACC